MRRIVVRRGWWVLAVALAAVALVDCSGSHAHGVTLSAGHPTTSAAAPSATTAPASTTSVPALATTSLPAGTVAPGSSETVGAACGVERWAEKTGTDGDAPRVDTNPQDTTIASLDALAAPSEPNARVAPVEFTTYRIHVTITAYKEEADGDVHLALSDGSGHTMIAEIPSPDCVSGGPFRDAIARARATFDARHPSVDRFHTIDETATIAGVGFFDFIHGQRGVAPNGIELHPVLAIDLG